MALTTACYYETNKCFPTSYHFIQQIPETQKKEKINFIAVEFIHEEKLRFSRLLSQEQQKWHFLNKVEKNLLKILSVLIVSESVV